MPFQTKINYNMSLGMVGTMAFLSPHRTQMGTLNSTDPSKNIIGNAFFVVQGAGDAMVSIDDPQPQTVSAGFSSASSAVFAGLLISPHEYTTSGTSDGALSPTITMRNGEIVQLALMGEITTMIAAASGNNVNVGDSVFAKADGSLVSAAASAAPSGAVSINGIVHYYQAQSGLAVLRLMN